MSDDTSITHRMHSYGWNFHLLATPSEEHFAGLYQDPDNPFLTFRDLVDELRLCFRDRSCLRYDENWEGVAFGLGERHRSNVFPLFVAEGELDTVIPSLPQPDPQRRAVVRYHVVRCSGCHLPENSPLEDHLNASCASHIPFPTRRHDPRYLALDATSHDQVTRISLRPTQSLKRKRSGSTSLDKEPSNASEIILPPWELMAPTRAREIVNSFRAAVISSAKRCAVTGMGRHWCPGLHIGPGMQACHIAPQQHFYVYATGDDPQDTEFSGQRILQAWLDTWDHQNGLLLRRDIRELFDARLLSIHPDSIVSELLFRTIYYRGFTETLQQFLGSWIAMLLHIITR